MYYHREFIHRLQEDFLIIGYQDLEEIQQLGEVEYPCVSLSLDALSCLPYLNGVTHLILTPGVIQREELGFLQGLKIKSLKLDYESFEIDDWTVDLGNFPNLELVFARTQYCFRNVVGCRSLKTLIVGRWQTQDLENLQGSSLRALKIMSGKLRSLEYIKTLPMLRSLSLSNQRHLQDCTDLNRIALESLRLEACNQVDLTALPELDGVRMLALSGRKTLKSVNDVICRFPNLEWIFLDHRIENGDLSPLLMLKHVVIFTDCHHYSHKNCQLPKANEGFCSYTLPVDLEILPEAYPFKIEPK